MIWHDLECGGYVEDLSLWRALAAEHGDPVLDVGAGTGRTSLDLARHGYRVTALDSDQALIAELERRADGLEVEAVVADAREFELGRRFVLCIVPMQTIQLLGSADGRGAFLQCVKRHLQAQGVLAIAIAEMLELYDVADGAVEPLPDICEIDGVVYSSRPTAVRLTPERFVLERTRETVTAAGEHSAEQDVVELDRVGAGQLEDEARLHGLESAGRARIEPTTDYTGSTVVMLRA